MSKLYDTYLRLKKENSQKLYLFRCGNFYIFLDEDAETINNYVVLKLTTFSKNVKKCGFPVSSLENYQRVFQNLKLQIEIVDENTNLTDDKRFKKIQERLKKIDIDHTTPVRALLELEKLKEIIDGK